MKRGNTHSNSQAKAWLFGEVWALLLRYTKKWKSQQRRPLFCPESNRYTVATLDRSSFSAPAHLKIPLFCCGIHFLMYPTCRVPKSRAFARQLALKNRALILSLFPSVSDFQDAPGASRPFSFNPSLMHHEGANPQNYEKWIGRRHSGLKKFFTYWSHWSSDTHRIKKIAKKLRVHNTPAPGNRCVASPRDLQ